MTISKGFCDHCLIQFDNRIPCERVPVGNTVFDFCPFCADDYRKEKILLENHIRDLQIEFSFKWKKRKLNESRHVYFNLDGECPDNIAPDVWEKLKKAFDKIYYDNKEPIEE